MTEPWAFQAIASPAAQQFAADPMAPSRPFSTSGYDALQQRGRRKSIDRQPRHEDLLQKGFDRDRLIANGRDLDRNFELFAWAVQQHLNYVTDLNFFPDTGSDGLDEDLEGLVEEWSEAENWDTNGEHDRDQWLRLAEATTCTGGDVLAVRVNGGTAQAIEPDRIRNPEDADDSWSLGVQKRNNRRANFCVWDRDGNGFKNPRTIPAKNAYLMGYFKRFDQGRGVSPLTAAFNRYRDTYESIDHAQQRAKISNILALTLERASTEAGAFTYDDVDLANGPAILDMNPGDKAAFLESHLPSNEFQAFTREVITLGLKALDIPMSFYREDLTNFFGSRAALMHYQRSTRWKRRRLIRLMKWLTNYRIATWLASGQIRLPRSMDPTKLRFTWQAAGIPWWDPSKEVSGDMLAVAAGWGDPYAISLEKTGRTLKQNITNTCAAIAEANKIAAAAGVEFKLSFVPPSTAAPTPQDQPAADQAPGNGETK